MEMDVMDGFAKLVTAEGIDRLHRLTAILEAVDQEGSLNRAATRLTLSYRLAWGIVQRAEQMIGYSLLVRRTGGPAGGGAALTDTGRELVTRYRILRHEVEHILERSEDDPMRAILMASTIGPVEVGLMSALEAGFHEATGLWVRHIATGSGQALQIARTGRVDLLLTHAPGEEEQFIADGWGLARHPLMVNDFVVCGPPHDPAAIGTAHSAVEAMARIGAKQASFLTRGDQSGTHLKELALWASTGVVPTPPWYCIFAQGGLGSGATLREAAHMGAYILADRATYFAAAPTNLAILFEGDPSLVNCFSLLALNPERFAHIHSAGAQRFIAWATSAPGQAIIAGSPYRPVQS